MRTQLASAPRATPDESWHHARGFNDSTAFALQRKTGQRDFSRHALLKSVGIANQRWTQDPSRAIYAAARSSQRASSDLAQRDRTVYWEMCDGPNSDGLFLELENDRVLRSFAFYVHSIATEQTTTVVALTSHPRTLRFDGDDSGVSVSVSPEHNKFIAANSTIACSFAEAHEVA